MNDIPIITELIIEVGENVGIYKCCFKLKGDVHTYRKDLYLLSFVTGDNPGWYPTRTYYYTIAGNAIEGNYSDAFENHTSYQCVKGVKNHPILRIGITLALPNAEISYKGSFTPSSYPDIKSVRLKNKKQP